jgi:hypothetical protein
LNEKNDSRRAPLAWVRWSIKPQSACTPDPGYGLFDTLTRRALKVLIDRTGGSKQEFLLRQSRERGERDWRRPRIDT